MYACGAAACQFTLPDDGARGDRGAGRGEKGPLADEAILRLFDALDGYIALPERSRDKPFLMPIEGVHSISGRGAVVTERGAVRTTDVTGRVEHADGAEMVLPGDSTEFTVKLHEPVALAEHSRFAIREGDRTVGAGLVTRIAE